MSWKFLVGVVTPQGKNLVALGWGLLSQGPGLASGLWYSPLSDCALGFQPLPCLVHEDGSEFLCPGH